MTDQKEDDMDEATPIKQSKDLNDGWRSLMESNAELQVYTLSMENQSLAIAREAWINSFDKAAEELDAVLRELRPTV